jgi:glycine oxidase
VGQGLAGSALALQLNARGKRFIVFDEPEKNRCSRVAAGMFNPFASKGLIKTWMAEPTFSALHSFYPAAEKLLNTRFFYPQRIYRPFLTIEEQNNWLSQTSDPSIQAFVESTHTQSVVGNHIHDPLGGIVAKRGGYVDAPIFLEAVKKWLLENESYIAEQLTIHELQEKDGTVHYQNLEAKKIIFCTGISGDLPWLPVIKLKGEVLLASFSQELDLIYNRGVYAVATRQPMVYKAGSTYQLKNIVEGITETGRQELEAKMNQLFKVPFKIIGHEWGLRPTTIDRKPILGAWPGHENRVIFNGLGTKGVSLAPYFSGLLADWLEGQTEINKEVNITRFKALYSNF